MDLSTTYLGLKLANPLMPGSSPLSKDPDAIHRLVDHGAAAIVLHSLFEDAAPQTVRPAAFLPSREQFRHPFRYTDTPSSYFELVAALKKTIPVPVIASISCTTPAVWPRYASSIQSCGADALELNVYAAPTDLKDSAADLEKRLTDVVASVRQQVSIPIAVKLCPFYTSLPHLTQQLEEAGAAGLVLFHRFYQPDFDVPTRTVNTHVRLSHVSDPTELRLRLHWLAILSPQTRMSLGLTGGVHTGLDAIKGIMAGAHGVQVVSSLLSAGPTYMKDMLASLSNYMESLGVDCVEDIRGCMNYGNYADPAALERSGYRAVLASWEKLAGTIHT
jgi:dihydroorotate dehydrogenase (fumarate)